MARIGLKHLFYVTALIASSIGLMGWPGIWVAGFITAIWWHVYFGRPSATLLSRFKEAAIVSMIMSVLGLCLVPAVRVARPAAHQMACANNMKQIGLALHNYHEVYRSFPPAITYDATGKPMHSWRVLILPWIEGRQLYDAYSMDEPWDGPNNSKLLSRIPPVFVCPATSNRSNFTTKYCVVIGEKTLFPPYGSRSFKDIRDGTSNTIAVVEQTSGIPWMAPLDPTLENFLSENRASKHTTKVAHFHSDLMTHYYSPGQMGLADGSVSRAIDPDAEDMWRRLLLLDDGGPTYDELEEANQLRSTRTSPRIEGYVALLAFLGITLLPVIGVFWRADRNTTLQ